MDWMHTQVYFWISTYLSGSDEQKLSEGFGDEFELKFPELGHINFSSWNRPDICTSIISNFFNFVSVVIMIIINFINFFMNLFKTMDISSWLEKVTSRAKPSKAENSSAQAMARASSAWAHHYNLCIWPLHQSILCKRRTVFTFFVQ